jgi:integrase
LFILDTKRVKALQIYIDARPTTYDELWLSHRFTPLRKDGIYQILERIAKRAGVDRFNPHAFRHALAKRLVARGTPMKAVADLMGHEDVTTTMTMYVTYDDEELDAIHKKYSGR